MNKILGKWLVWCVCLPAIIFLSCSKTELKKECFIPYVDFVAYNVDPSSLKVEFSGITSYNGNINSYQWDFGDGTTFTGQTPPPHTYPPFAPTDTIKTYRIRYTVGNDCGQSYWTQEVRLSRCLPDVKFAVTQLNDSIVQFTNQSTSNSAITYNWTFGDGSTGTDNAATFTKKYNASGTYTVSLKGTNSCGDNFFTTTVTICRKPVANFTSSVTNGNTVSFNASSSLNATSYQWDFGNGVTSTVQSSPAISYNYTTAGTYNVILTASNNCGNATVTHAVTISCAGVGNIASVPYTSDDLTFTFSPVTAVNATAYQWNFGDGTNFTGQNPGSRTYNLPGIYTLTVQASNACSNTSTSSSVAVPAVLVPGNTPLTNFTAVAAKDGNTIYYVGSNGNFYLYNGASAWTNLGSIPITYNANTKLTKDPSNNIWVYGTNGVAKWTGSGWTTYTASSLGYPNGTVIVDMDVDNSGNLWTTGNKQVRRGNSLIYNASGVVSSIKYATVNNRLWFTITGNNKLYYYTNGNVDNDRITNMDNNSGSLTIDPTNNSIYFASKDGIIRVSSTGNYEGYFSSANTTYLNNAPVKIQVDNRGYIWVLESAGGDFLRISKNLAQTSAKRYNALPEINNVNDFDLVNITGTNNDLFLAKSQANAAIRIY